MGIKDVAKKAAEKATPVIKEKAVDAGRMAKVMGETVIEEKPVRSAARSVGNAVKSALDSHNEKVQERDIDTFTDLKSKYPGCIILFSTNAPFNYRKLEKLGVNLGIISEDLLAMILFDESKAPKYRVNGNFEGIKRIFALTQWNHKPIGLVNEHNRLINIHESIVLGTKRVLKLSNLFKETEDQFSDPSYRMVTEGSLLNWSYIVYKDDQPILERRKVKGFEILAITDPALEHLCILIHIALTMLHNQPSRGGCE